MMAVTMMMMMMEEISRAIAAQQSEIRELVESGASASDIAARMAAVDRLESEYKAQKDRDKKQLTTAIEAQLAELSVAPVYTFHTDDADPASVIRWNTVLAVWHVGQKWKQKTRQAKLRGEATRLLKKLEQKEALQSEICDLRAALYAMRQRKSLSDEDALIKRRLEEYLRIAGDDLKDVLQRDADAAYVRYSDEEMSFVHRLESGCVLLLCEKEGKSKPVPQLFTLDPFSGCILWGDDRDAQEIHSGSVVGVEWGTAAMIHTKYIPDSQLRYCLRLRLGLRASDGGQRSHLSLVACNEDDFELWSRGVQLVMDRLRDSPVHTSRKGSASSDV